MRRCCAAARRSRSRPPTWRASRRASRAASSPAAHLPQAALTSSTPATKNASGPVTSRGASRERTPPRYRSPPSMASPVKTTLTELPESRVRVDAEVPAAEVEKSLAQAARRLARDTRVPGFRKGKVPPPVFIRRVGREYVLDEAIRGSIGTWYADALGEAKVVPIGEPKLDLGDLPPEGEPLSFSFEIGVRPTATLGDYAGLEVGKREPEVDDERIAHELGHLREQLARLETVERAAEQNDFVVVDYKGSIDGELFEGGEGHDQLIELGGGRLIPGFEEQLVGASAGDERTIDVTFPDDYGADHLAGRPAQFAISVKEVRARVLPKVDDELAAAAAGFDTLDELREDIRRRIAEQEERTVEA